MAKTHTWYKSLGQFTVHTNTDIILSRFVSPLYLLFKISCSHGLLFTKCLHTQQETMDMHEDIYIYIYWVALLIKDQSCSSCIINQFSYVPSATLPEDSIFYHRQYKYSSLSANHHNISRFSLTIWYTISTIREACPDICISVFALNCVLLPPQTLAGKREEQDILCLDIITTEDMRERM